MSSKRTKLRVETVKKTVKGRVYTSVLLRCSYRQDGKVKHETVGNLTQLPPDVIDFKKRRLSGELDRLDITMRSRARAHRPPQRNRGNSPRDVRKER